VTDELWLAIATPGVLLVGLLGQWIERHGIRRLPWDPLPPFRLMIWGWTDGHPFLIVRLPSWEWERSISRYMKPEPGWSISLWECTP
jgi:hypothetical protein